MTIQIIRRASLGLAAGTIRTLAPATEAALVLDGEAIYATAPNPGGDDLTVRLDPTSRQIVGADGAPIPAQVALSALVSGGGISVSITYDTAGRVATVTSASGSVYTYAYSATSGLLSTITGGGITQTFNYGADGTLSSVTQG